MPTQWQVDPPLAHLSAPHSLPLLRPTSLLYNNKPSPRTLQYLLPTSKYPIELLFFNYQQKCLPERGSKMTRSLLRSLVTTARKKKSTLFPHFHRASSHIAFRASIGRSAASQSISRLYKAIWLMIRLYAPIQTRTCQRIVSADQYIRNDRADDAQQI